MLDSVTCVPVLRNGTARRRFVPRAGALFGVDDVRNWGTCNPARDLVTTAPPPRGASPLNIHTKIILFFRTGKTPEELRTVSSILTPKMGKFHDSLRGLKKRP